MRIALIYACLALLALPAQAQHAHGEGRMDIAIDRERLAISLELPLDAAVGFERAPKTEKEKAALAAAQQAVADPTLFMPTPAAACKPEAPKVVLPESGKAGGEQHADIEASHVFRCANPAALKSVETTIFKSFKRLYRLEARRAGPGGQGAARLTPKHPVIAW
ncbi:MAG: DUF2796 domain-containing protein [Rhodocyclales bacterium]|nr:DUF2796 domain-containing protein [Rhodocyclales bacterium]